MKNLIEKVNYKHNRQITLPDGFINGQGKGAVSRMKYGICTMAWNGCEMIALYNALVHIKRPENLSDICREMYPRSSVLMGFFGSNVYVLGGFFDRRKIKYKKTYMYNNFFNELKNYDCGVCSFWNHRLLFSSLHTVCIKAVDDGKIVVYNKTNGKTEPAEILNRSALTNKKLFMVGYLIKGDEKNET